MPFSLVVFIILLLLLLISNERTVLTVSGYEKEIIHMDEVFAAY